MKIKIKLDQTRGAMPTRPGEKTGAVTHRLQSFVNRRLRTILGPGWQDQEKKTYRETNYQSKMEIKGTYCYKALNNDS